MKTLCICIGSKDFFGAERRFIKIMKFILAERQDVTLFLIVNSSLYQKSLTTPFAHSFFEEMDTRNALIVIPDKPADVLAGRRLGKFFSLLCSDAKFHLVLRARVLLILRALVGRSATIEVTSPEVAAKIGSRFPLWVLKRADNFACVSPNVARIFRESVAARSPELAGALRLPTWTTPYSEQKNFVAAEKENIVVCASRFIARKNVKLFAQVVARVAPSLSTWKFVILGQGPEEEEIKTILRREIDNGQATVGYVSDVGEVLRKSKIYASLIEPDNFPSQSIVEAMAYGNALLVSNTGNSFEFFNDARSNGKLVSVNEDDVVSALTTMTSDESALALMGQESFAMIGSKFSGKSFVDTLLAVHGF